MPRLRWYPIFAFALFAAVLSNYVMGRDFGWIVGGICFAVTAVLASGVLVYEKRHGP